MTTKPTQADRDCAAKIQRDAILRQGSAVETIAAHRLAHSDAALFKRVETLEAALGQAIEVFEGMCDDEIEEELLPGLRAALGGNDA